MNGELASPPRTASLLWPAAFLEAGGALGLWLGLSQGSLLLAGAVLAVTALLGTIWLSRDRTARRWQVALDVYARREIARAEQRKLNPFPARRRVP